MKEIAGARGRYRFLFFVVFVVGFGLPAWAQPETALSHLVKEGETLASISTYYYGTDDHENLLVADNALGTEGGQSIVIGMTLRIPTVVFHEVKPGETWRTLAERYLGAARRGRAIARANKADPTTLPDAGGIVEIPYPLRFTAKRGSRLKSIAARYLGSASSDNLSLLREFNPGISRKMRRSRIVVIPIDYVRVTEAVRANLRKASGGYDVEKRKQRQSEFAKKIEKLREEFRKGRFIRVIATGNQLIGSKALTSTQEVSTQLLLAQSYVAEEDEDLAKKALRRAKSLQPDLRLPADKYSPKLRAIAESLQPSA